MSQRFPPIPPGGPPPNSPQARYQQPPMQPQQAPGSGPMRPPPQNFSVSKAYKQIGKKNNNLLIINFKFFCA